MPLQKATTMALHVREEITTRSFAQPAFCIFAMLRRCVERRVFVCWYACGK